MAPAETGDWDKLAREVRHWVDQHQSSRIPQAAVGRRDRKTKEPYPLGKRVKAVRQRYRRGSLPASQISFFEGLPGWSWTVHASNDPQLQDQLPQYFLERLRQITEHLESNDGILRLDRMQPALHQAINHFRIQLRQGKLTPQQITALNAANTAILDVDARQNAQTTRHTATFVRRTAGWILDNDPQMTLVDIAAATPTRSDPLHSIKLGLQLRLRRHAGLQDPALNDAELELLNQLPGWEQAAGELA